MKRALTLLKELLFSSKLFPGCEIIRNSDNEFHAVIESIER